MTLIMARGDINNKGEKLGSETKNEKVKRTSYNLFCNALLTMMCKSVRQNK